MLEIDCHGKTTKEVYKLLQELSKNNRNEKIKLITGLGNHTKNRPQMDYFCEKNWKCPIKKVIIDYIVYEKNQGARMFEYPAYIIWQP
jgi:hypothetical protein